MSLVSERVGGGGAGWVIGRSISVDDPDRPLSLDLGPVVLPQTTSVVLSWLNLFLEVSLLLGTLVSTMSGVCGVVGSLWEPLIGWRGRKVSFRPKVSTLGERKTLPA